MFGLQRSVQSIRTKATLLFLAVAAGPLLLAFSLFVYNQIQNDNVATTKQLLAVAQLLSQVTAPAIEADDDIAANEVLRNLEALPSVTFAGIYLPSGVLFTSYGPHSAVNRPADGSLFPDLAQRRIDAALRDGTVTEQSLVGIDVYVLVENGTDPVGILHVRKSRRDFILTISRMLLVGLAGFGFCLVLAFAMAKKVQDYLIGPVIELSQAMDRIAGAKKFELRLKSDRSDELGHLYDGFNTMLSRLQRRDDALRKIRENLESEVAKRTRQLQNANQYLEQEIEVRRLTETQLLQAKERAEAASTAKSQFLAKVSHELRTPMNGVLGMTDLLLQTELDERQQHFAATLQSSAEILLETINDTLDFSKIESGEMTLERIPIDFGAIVEETVLVLAGLAHRKGLEIVSFVDASVPPRVYGDPERLRQILMNLVGNAIKFTEEGEVTVSLRTLSATDGHVTLALQVRDTGVGIAPADCEHIFEAFHQSDASLSRRYQGTGLGLAIVKHLVDLMGGTVSVRSKQAEGTLFTVELKLPQAPGTNEPVDTNRLESCRCLVVDDNATNREVLSLYLAEWGISHDMAENGEAALQIVKQAPAGRFDLAILDVSMPDMDGAQLATALRDEPQLAGLKIVLLGSTEWILNQTERTHAFDTKLSKPIRKHDLRRVLISLFAAQVPAAQPSDEDLPLPAREQQQFDACVLLVEDNPVNEEITREYLTQLGCDVTIARNGKEAVDTYAPNRFDLILMDCQMPVMDGLAATREIRDFEATVREPERIPIIALTAHVFESDHTDCRKAGMDDVICKPFAIDELRHALERWAGAVRGPQPAAHPAD